MGRYSGNCYLSDFTADEIESLLHKVKVAKTFDAHSCPNCGAPLNEYGGCDYCGTGRQSELEKPKADRTEWTYYGKPMYDGEAIIVLNGKVHRCTVYRTDIIDQFGGRDMNGQYHRGVIKRQFCCIEN